MQEVYDIFGEKGMAFLARVGTDDYMKATSNTLLGNATFTSPTLSAFTLQAASDKMSKHPVLLEGMTSVHAAYTEPRFMVQYAVEYLHRELSQCPSQNTLTIEHGYSRAFSDHLHQSPLSLRPPASNHVHRCSV